MIGQATAHRRANAFAQALETAAVQGEADTHSGPAADRAPGSPVETAGEHGAHAADRHADPAQGRLLALTNALGELPKPMLSDETRTVQRARLIAAMENALADGSLDVSSRVPEQRTGRGAHRATGLGKLTPRSRWSRRLAVGGLSVSVAAGALGGVAAASTDALPGDALYGLKRGMEDLKLDMSDNDASRGQVYLDMAGTRMQEARRLMERGRAGDLDSEFVREVRKALSGMHQEAAEGHRLLTAAYQRDGSLRPMEVLNDFSASHRQDWTDLRDRLPSQLTDVSDQVTSVFAAIDEDVAPLQGLLPKEPDGKGSGHRRRAGTPGAETGRSGTNGPSASGSTPSDGRNGTAGNGTPSPSPSGSSHGGLLGGTDGVLEPPPTSGTTSSAPGQTTQPSVTLPPLLPGLIGGIGGIGIGDSKE